MDKELLKRLANMSEKDLATASATKVWETFVKSLEGKSERQISLELAEVSGAPIDIDKQYPSEILELCEKKIVSKDKRYFYFRIDSARVKQVYAIDANGVVQLVKIAKEGLQQISVSPLNTPVQYMPYNDVLSAEGYNALDTMKKDATSSSNLAEIEKFFAVLAAAVPVGNKFTLTSGKTKFILPNLQAMRAQIKDYADKFWLLTGFNVDEDITGWDYDENKYRSIHDMAKDLNVTISYVGNYTLKKDGADTKVIDNDKAYLVGLNSKLGNRPFIFARKEIANVPFKDAEVDANNQRILQMVPQLITIGGNPTMCFGYWAYSEVQIVCKSPLMLAEFNRV